MRVRHTMLARGMLSLLLALSLLPSAAFAAERPADIAAGRWSAKYIDAALNDATIALREDGGFAPQDAVTHAGAAAALRALTGTDLSDGAGAAPITRGEFAALLYRYVKSAGEGFVGAWAFPLRYPDAASVPETQYEALCWLTMKGVLRGGEDGAIAAGATLTREQLAVALYRYEAVIRTFAAQRVDYAKAENWAYRESDVSGKSADVFFVCPTVIGGGAGKHLMLLSGKSARENFLGAINMEKGIYDADARFFAPYYRQIGLATYALAPEETERYLGYAYQDVRDAFDYYTAICQVKCNAMLKKTS